jgi:hypothetical protein
LDTREKIDQYFHTLGRGTTLIAPLVFEGNRDDILEILEKYKDKRVGMSWVGLPQRAPAPVEPVTQAAQLTRAPAPAVSQGTNLTRTLTPAVNQGTNLTRTLTPAVNQDTLYVFCTPAVASPMKEVIIQPRYVSGKYMALYVDTVTGARRYGKEAQAAKFELVTFENLKAIVKVY